MRLPELSISLKLPVLIVGAALVAGIATGVVSFVTAEQQLRTATENKLDSLLETRRSAVSAYFEGVATNLRVLATSPAVRGAVNDLTIGWQSFGFERTEALQAAFITNNPDKEDRSKLDDAKTGNFYSPAHIQHHPWLRSVRQESGYGDLMLFDASANLIYTVAKNDDFATSFRAGPFKETHLAKLVKAIRDNPEAGKIVMADFAPYKPNGDKPTSFLGTAVFQPDGAFSGVLAVQLPVDGMNRVLGRTEGMGQTGETYLVGSDLMMRSVSRFSGADAILSTHVESDSVKAALEGRNGVHEIENYRKTEVISSYRPVDVFGIRWALIGEIDAAEVFADIESLRTTLLLTGTALLAILAGLGIITARGIARPLSAITQAMNRLASGDLNVTIPGRKRSDEIGKMATAFDVFKQQALDNDRLAREQEALEERAAEVKRRTLNELAQSLEASVNHVVQEVSGLADDMESTALGMTRTAEETSRQSGHVSDAAQHAAEFVQNVASAADQLSRSITNITGQVQEAGRVAGDAVQNADVITDTMRTLSEAAQRIGQVVDLINGIAGQTNLLALNATIEAARAGEAGKGFAVVAGEVKQLATQTARATGDIAAQVQMIQATTKQAVDGMAGIATIIRRLDQINGEIAGAIDQQDRATSDIASSIQSAAASTNTVSGSIGGVTQAAIDTGDAAVHVLAIAGKLNEESTDLLETIEGFVRQLRDTADGDAVELAPPANDSDDAPAQPVLISAAAE